MTRKILRTTPSLSTWLPSFRRSIQQVNLISNFPFSGYPLSIYVVPSTAYSIHASLLMSLACQHAQHCEANQPQLRPGIGDAGNSEAGQGNREHIQPHVDGRRSSLGSTRAGDGGDFQGRRPTGEPRGRQAVAEETRCCSGVLFICRREEIQAHPPELPEVRFGSNK